MSCFDAIIKNAILSAAYHCKFPMGPISVTVMLFWYVVHSKPPMEFGLLTDSLASCLGPRLNSSWTLDWHIQWGALQISQMRRSSCQPPPPKKEKKKEKLLRFQPNQQLNSKIGKLRFSWRQKKKNEIMMKLPLTRCNELACYQSSKFWGVRFWILWGFFFIFFLEKRSSHENGWWHLKDLDEIKDSNRMLIILGLIYSLWSIFSAVAISTERERVQNRFQNNCFSAFI